MMNEKSNICIELLKNAGVTNPEKYMSIIESMQLNDMLGAIEFVRNADGSLKKLRFGFFAPQNFSSMYNENIY